ncbi:MAG TPA: radical SAM protein [Chloroflexia bacterium]|nr:radical SAM protein [Chloroflexia bacterium]
MLEVRTKKVKSILTPQKGGFTTRGSYPFTHTLSAYTGCGFGSTTCGLYCYARTLPNWTYLYPETEWGQHIEVKENAPALLEETLSKMSSASRSKLRILMSSTTDPYQPLENTYRLTRQCLEIFCRYPDLDLLLIQTRSPLARRDLDLMLTIPYAWLSVTIETDDQALLKQLRGGPSLDRRFALVKEASRLGLPAQVAVSPCLPYTPDFAARLIETGARRVVVDSFVEGDGAKGERTRRSPYAALMPNWSDPQPARELYQQLKLSGQVEVGWSAAGFSAIPPRLNALEGQSQMFDQL